MTKNPVSWAIQTAPAVNLGSVGYVLGGAGLFGDGPADYMYDLGYNLGGMVGTVVNPIQWAYGYVNTATGNA
jgi:hypothetical protein